MTLQTPATLHCEVIQRAAQPTLAIRTITSGAELKSLYASTYQRITQYLGELGTFPSGPPFGMYHNMDMQRLDVEIGFPVAQKALGRGDIKASELPAGKYASCVFTGPYDKVSAGWETLMGWVGAHHHQPVGPYLEVYLNDPGEVAPEQLLTQILVGLK